MSRLTPEGADLQRATTDTVRAVDDVFRRLADDVVAVLRPYGTRPLTEFDRVTIRRDIDRRLARVFGGSRSMVRGGSLYRELVARMNDAGNQPFRRSVRDLQDIVTVALGPDEWERIRQDVTSVFNRRAVNARSLDPGRKWVPRDKWTTKTGYSLSDRLWTQGRALRDAIDEQIRQALAEGTSADRLARQLRQYVNHEQDIATPEARRQRRRHAKVATRTLARTEITRVLGAATIEAAKVTPGLLGVRWVLSASHAGHVDECDHNASGSSAGLPPGVYTVDEVPQYPNHPNEKCHIQRAMKSRDEVLNALLERFRDDDEGMAA